MNDDTLTLVLKRVDNAISTILPDGYVAIIQLGNPIGFTLTPAGSLLWELSDGDFSVSEIVEEVYSLLAGAVAESGTGEAVSREALTVELAALAKELVANEYLRPV